MNKIDFNANGLAMPTWKGKADSFIKKVLRILGKKNWDLSVMFCSDEFIKELNAKYRNRGETTDILSFPLGETVVDEVRGERFHPGDIVISLDTLKEHSVSFGVPEDEELRRLLIHGILHLDGMDHSTNKSGEPMLVRQEEILKSLEGERIMGTQKKNA